MRPLVMLYLCFDVRMQCFSKVPQPQNKELEVAEPQSSAPIPLQEESLKHYEVPPFLPCTVGFMFSKAVSRPC